MLHRREQATRHSALEITLRTQLGSRPSPASAMSLALSPQCAGADMLPLPAERAVVRLSRALGLRPERGVRSPVLASAAYVDALPPTSRVSRRFQRAGPYWPAMLARSSRRTLAFAFATAPAADRLPVLAGACSAQLAQRPGTGVHSGADRGSAAAWPAMLSRSSRSVSALGNPSVAVVAGAGGVASGPMVVVAR